MISSRIAIELNERFRWVISNTSMAKNQIGMARGDSKLTLVVIGQIYDTHGIRTKDQVQSAES